MRILFDSKDLKYKKPFGTLTPGEICRLRIDIPTSVQTTQVVCKFQWEDGAYAKEVALSLEYQQDG